VPRASCGAREDVVVAVVVAVVVVIAAAVTFVGVMLLGMMAAVRWMALPRGCGLFGEKGSSVSVIAFPLPRRPLSRSVVLASGRWVVVDCELPVPPFEAAVGRKVGESSSSEPSPSDETKVPSVVFLWD
jgi:hypothetical protein